MLTYYYPRTTRIITTAIQDVFNDLVVKNYNSPVSGAVSAANKTIPVPIFLSQPDKAYLSRLEEVTGYRYYGGYPSISIELEGMGYESSRAKGMREFRHFRDSNLNQIGSFLEDVQPSPWRFDFELKIRTHLMDHLSQILENVLPSFNPYLILRVREFSFLNLEREIMVELDENVNIQRTEPLAENGKREIIATIGLKAHGWLYRPIGFESIVKTIHTTYFINSFDVSGVVSEYTIPASRYVISGSDGYTTSAFPSSYSFSAYSNDLDNYYFTSAQSFTS